MDITKILLIDDEPKITKDILINYGYEVDVAMDGYSGLQQLLQPDVSYELVILDLHMPKMDGWSVLKAIREGEDCPWIPVIMLTSADTDQSMMMGLRRGADAYLSKPVIPGVLLAQMEAVLRRTQWDVQENKAESDEAESHAIGLLTQRETEILKHVVQGLSNQEISETLSIAETTVKNHLASIYKKLDVSNRNQAAYIAQKFKLF